MLSVLPASETQSGSPTGFLSVGSSPLLELNKFNARGLDAGYFFYNTSASKGVGFQ